MGETIHSARPNDPRAMDPILPEMGIWGYQHQWWLVSQEAGDFQGAGHLGQYLYINPKDRVIIVRVGRQGDETKEWV